MQEREKSHEEWLEALSDAARDRYHRTVAELETHRSHADPRQRVRADMEQRHAPLAFETFFQCIHPGEWTQGARTEVEALLRREDLRWQERFGPHIRPAREAVDRILANGGSHEDLAAFAFLVAAAKVDDVGFTLSQGEFFQDLPGWRLMETWHGEHTGRPLSPWGIYQMDAAVGAGPGRHDRPADVVPTGDHQREAPAPAPPDPALVERPLLGPEFREAVERAEGEESNARERARRGSGRAASRARRAEFGAIVLTVLATLRQALERDDDGTSAAAGGSSEEARLCRSLNDEAFECLMAVPLRTVVTGLSAMMAERRVRLPPAAHRE